MPDISLCLWRKTCPLAPLCYRATAEPGELGQSYIAPDEVGKDCQYFMPTTSASAGDKSQSGGAHKVSRKTIFTILAVIGSTLTVFASTLGLTINPTVVLAGVASVLVYVFGEGKADLAKIGSQDAKDKLKDPKVWLAAASAGLVALTEAGVTLPVSPELIIAVLTAIMGILFKTDSRLAKPTA